jgi:hypothetical protein
MKSNYTLIWVILAAAAIIGMVTLNVQQTYAPRECPGCVQFKKLTHDFEKNAIDAIGNPNDEPHAELIPEYHKVWEDGVMRIFQEGPGADQIRIPLQSYGQDMATLLDFYFDGELQQHDLTKQFRQLTHAVATEVLTLAHEGFKGQ